MVVARCWQQWITEGCTVAEGQDVPGTQMIARSCNQKSGHFGTNNVASIDSTPPPSRHFLFDWILPTSGNLECDRLETCHLHDESQFSLSDDDHRTCLNAFIVEYSNFTR
ncbi:hypothetical protein TNCV_494201 [Trichonephila clavipes]|nr:hypothetical protein TNCV_494201 [Trichonephila clavipes]